MLRTGSGLPSCASPVPGAGTLGTSLRRAGRAAIISLAAAAALAGAVSPASAAAVTPVQSPGTCVRHTVPVTLPGLPGSHHVSGVLCLPDGTVPDAVQVLIPGATYDNTYFRFRVPGYSYALYAREHGQATFAMDRLNTGHSSKLPSAMVTVGADAGTVHQVISALAHGAVGGVHFTRFVTVGHSLGSVIAVTEGAQYKDVDGVILTGYTHHLSAGFIAAAATLQALVPAQLVSPRFATQPAGDLTTPGGTRSQWFYAPGDASPRVVAEDQATESVTTSGELATALAALAVPGTSGQLTVPVLQAVGSNDRAFYCGLSPCATSSRLRSAEARYFGSSPSYTAYVLPGSGHCVALAKSHGLVSAEMVSWIATHIPG